MSKWDEDELTKFCEKQIALKNYVVAEELLWEMNRKDRGNPSIMVLLGRIFEETRQFELAVSQYNAALLLSPDDTKLTAKRDACLGRPNNPRGRQGLSALRAGTEAGPLRCILGNVQYHLSVANQQLNALREQVWPEIAALPLERWRLSDADIDALTMGGKAKFSYWVGSTADNLVRGPGYPQIYTDSQVDHYLEKIAAREQLCYGKVDSWLYQAIEANPIDGKEGAVIGSLSPWYESICLHYGARPTTIDYTKIICKSSRLKWISVEEFYQMENVFDFAISISSIEHDGLGGYQTPVSPDADLAAMQKLSRAVKPGGLCFFNVPVGQDLVEYPTQRTYGRVRLPLLLDGWEVVTSWNFMEKIFDADDPTDPLFVLRNAK
jgi:hypothetical protein